MTIKSRTNHIHSIRIRPPTHNKKNKIKKLNGTKHEIKQNVEVSVQKKRENIPVDCHFGYINIKVAENMC